MLDEIFPLFRTYAASKRDCKEDTAPNQMLNYGYTVLAALCHRSLIIHGLLPQMGVHHKPRYRSDPLVYDVMEETPNQLSLPPTSIRTDDVYAGAF